MQWTKPDYEEISLGGEVTAYVNTDPSPSRPEEPPGRADLEDQGMGGLPTLESLHSGA